MKMNGTTIGWLIGAFVWCIFMGVTAISIGFGALYPPMNYVAKPFVCPFGQLNFQQSVSNPMPGTTYTTTGWSCRNPGADTPTPIDPFRMALYAGPFYGLLLFVVGFYFWYMNVTFGSDTVIGKVVRRVQGGIGILALAFVIIFPMWPLISMFIPSPSPTPEATPLSTATPADPGSTSISALSIPTLAPPVIEPTSISTLAPATGHPTIASIEQSKSVYSSNGLSLETVAKEQYLPADYAKPGTLTFTVPLSLGRIQALWQYGWCATSSAILATDLKSIRLKFVLDGQTVPLDDFAVDESQAKSGEQCHTWYTALGPWPVGMHHLTTTVTFTGTINDGNADYPAGDYVLDYMVSIQY